MVNPDRSGHVRRLPTVTTASLNRLYANTFLVLDSHIHPIGSGTIHPQQVPHTTQVEHRSKDIMLQGRTAPILATVVEPPSASFWAYGLISCGEAYYFGKKILRMAGIVQMLHALQTPYDKYLYNAHRKRKRLV